MMVGFLHSKFRKHSDVAPYTNLYLFENYYLRVEVVYLKKGGGANQEHHSHEEDLKRVATKGGYIDGENKEAGEEVGLGEGERCTCCN